jgi:hypothetical protein
MLGFAQCATSAIRHLAHEARPRNHRDQGPGMRTKTALLGRIRLNKVPYQLAEVPQAGELQLFVSLAPGVAVEFVIQLSNSISTIVS